MLPRPNDADAPLIVTGTSVISESVFNDVIVRKHCSLHLCGDLRGQLTIETGARVVVEGIVDGKVINKGGKLTVNNGEGLAEFAGYDGPPEAEAGGVLRVNLAALVFNWGVLGKQTTAECAAVLSGNAYGCRADLVAGALAKSGCKTFFVSDLAEARRVRSRAPQSVIYVLNGFYRGAEKVFADIQAQPVISSAIEMAEWDAFVAASGWTGGFALHVSTGKSQFGVSVEEAAGFSSRLHSANFQITLLMSDLDNSADATASDQQIARVRELRRLYPGVATSLAQASGIFNCPKAHFDIVRSGPLLCGVNPTPGAPNPMQPVIELRARIVAVRDLAAGEAIFVNEAWVAKRRTRLAMVSVGYADGYARPDNGRLLQAIIGGQRCAVAGGPSLDCLPIDITEIADPRLARRGEMVTLIGADLPIDEFALATQTSASEVLVNFGPRFHRIYHAGN